MSKFYLTTAIPYVNGKPHIGHAWEYFQADTIKRYYDLLGGETLLLSGADENSLKNIQAAEKENLEIPEYLDKYSDVWKNTFKELKIGLDVFQRSSDQEKHWPGVQKLWELCQKNGDIYKKKYSGFYCSGCESFKTEKELTGGLCPIHQTKPELIEEENYFFRLSGYQEKLIELIESGKLKIIPENKKAEALSFIRSGLEDFSISRSVERARGVGVPVPGDDSQRIYVWFDALNIYMTGVGFGWNEEKWQKWWPADLHIIGKDINRFHTVYWPAMLLSAFQNPDLLPEQIFIHGFVNVEGGEKMSKSLGNVVDPLELAEKYGLEPLRFFLLSRIPSDSDGEFSLEKFKEVYNGELANGLGNLVARVAKLCEQNNFAKPPFVQNFFDPEIEACFKTYKFNEGLTHLWSQIAETDRLINEKKPWGLKEAAVKPILEEITNKILIVAFNLRPFLPETSEKILSQFTGKIKSSAPLFPRI